MHTDLTRPLELDDGHAIPRLGLGVFRAGHDGATERAVSWALDAGYRHIDTAAVYRNEAEVGAAIASSGLRRDDLFVTTKLWRDDYGYDAARRAIDESLARLGLEYVDLYLMHWPSPELRVETWRAMESIADDGVARSIGVSNYTEAHLRELLDGTRRPPAINQIELHPFWQRRETVAFCRRHGIAVEAWAPLTKAQRLDDPTLGRVARQLGKTPAQVLIRWSLQHGWVCLPKSSDRGRIAENIAVFDFELDAEAMATLDALDAGYRTAPGWDPTVVE